MKGGHELSLASASSGLLLSSSRHRDARLVSRLRSRVRMLLNNASQYLSYQRQQTQTTVTPSPNVRTTHQGGASRTAPPGTGSSARWAKQ